MKKDLKKYSPENLMLYLSKINQKQFRSEQILKWLYKNNVTSFNEMLNIPQNLRFFLDKNFFLSKYKLLKYQKSYDDTIKFVLQSVIVDDTQINKDLKFSSDNKKINVVECVAIPSLNNKNELTACISTQIGCAINCSFCATAKQGFTRNLSIGEIIGQINFISNFTKKKISNIVFMGQGEPFLNYDNLKHSLMIINDSKYLGIGARKITVSTSGIINKITEFANLKKQFRLAVSLHSAIQQTRDILMPGVKNFNLSLLKDSLLYYQKKTGRRITIEYMLLNDFNDDIKHLESMIDFTNNLNCYVNLMHYNKINDCIYQPSCVSVFEYWRKHIEKNNIPVYTRKSKGKDIKGACGQLIKDT